MTTPAQLRAMSDAATQGDWEDHGPKTICVQGLWANGLPQILVEFYQSRKVSLGNAIASKDFVLALVNAYRAGDLVHRDDVAAWQPIDTAPKDNTEVLLYTPGGIAIGIWEGREDDYPDHPGHDAGWYANGYSCDPVVWGRTEAGGFIGPGYLYDPQNQPTHWMPLPADPVAVEEPSDG